MKHLSLDIETYAGVDLGKSGVYAYTSDPTFRILLLAYAYDDEAVTVLDLEQGETIPETLAADLYDPSVYKHAYNAQFERICLGRSLQRYIAPEGWHCTMVHASSLSLPRSLAGVAKVLGLEEQKMDEGKRLIRSFSMPQKTRDGKDPVRKRPKDAPEDWVLFKDYCRQDVVVERAIRKRLESFPLTAKEQRYFELDQRINDRGVRVDTELLAHALEADRRSKEAANDQASALTGLENPNSVTQLKEWFDAQGYPVDALDKATVSELLEDADGEAREMLTLRQEMAKTSVGKYLAIARHLCPDKRVRGMFKFYGANRTGRFSGSGVQLQNLPRNTIKDLDAARTLLKEGRYEELGLLYGSVPQLLSELVRTAFIAEPGMVFLDADYASIEARVLAWLAGEQWVLDVFHGDGKIYEATAARMFGVPMASISKGSELRQKGKVAALACGYAGGTGALKAMGAVKMGLSEEELPGLIRDWRKANPKIVQFWHDIEKAALHVVREQTAQVVGRVRLHCRSGILFIDLPSGRSLHYIKPQLGENRFGNESVTYEGLGLSKWIRMEGYGGKFVENITQAIARDILVHGMEQLEAAGFPIVMHIHDEVVIETKREELETVCRIVSTPPDWAKDLPLAAEGFIARYFKKD